MHEYSINQVLNVLIFFVPLFILAIVLLIKRSQSIDIDAGQCAAAWERLIAFMIDIAICLLVFYGFIFILKKTGMDLEEKFEDIFFLLLSWLYFSVFESSEKQATFGKAHQGIIVADLNGNRITFWRPSIRYFFTIISNMALFIGHIIIVFTRYKQGLHDMVTSTLVLKKNGKGPLNPIFTEPTNHGF